MAIFPDGSVMNQLAGIGGKLIYNILFGVAAIAIIIGLYFGIKFVQKRTKKAKSFNINAIIIDLNGVVDFDMLGLQKSEESGLFEMVFKIRKQDSIPPIPRHLIKAGWTVLLNYSPGHYTIIDTSATMDFLNQGKKEIELYNLGMKKYLVSKQREIMNKAEKKRKNFELYAPWIALGAVAAIALVVAFLIFFFGGKIYSSNITQRIADCKQLFIHP